MELPRLKDPLTLVEYAEACDALGVDKVRALRDPVGQLPCVASAPISGGAAFLRLVLRRQCRVDLRGMPEDAARLLVSVVFCFFIDQVRRQTRRSALATA